MNRFIHKKRVFAIFAALLFCFFLSIISYGAGSVDDKIEAAIKTYILSKNPELKKENMEIKFTKTQKLIDLCAQGKDPLDFAVLKDYQLSKMTAHMILPLSVFSGGKEIGSAYLSVDFDVYKNIVVAGRKILKGSLISKEDIEILKKPTLALQKQYFTQVDGLIGKVAKGNIYEGSVVYDWMLKVNPDVAKGQAVKILARVDNLSIETQGVALEDGQIGKSIKVRRNDSKETFLAVILDKGIVEVQL
ncbi:flagella basal body P-ring formation protein FlgA [candidate division WOR-1 bacterium RIFOXYC2_FULL_37_10]|uniref:Flagella basal body P-ring formation protein FlgA n=1 Tax=candidate division WOR-1 bacterium RIFOXYB2_FULL_37_13 TaxID=1802579 RepID=A0A1F4SL67_UNCSA|nr:MAG: flagella basal body P-ring formation protein FlgA [candidate division WOR-1 bacterium RIFOXYA2_FULL_37_7]OGC21149.1 MAG: flagella basal body P-ring formation protein FlgA [candidate division WOR-1 bacterium RIFOXYB2_FULL_37_13]OGC36243.1 MAG: flagella basal body P-ring formation protein FlgA [candidate division WOR-1 bacterium RIFOXYC2_FULL_37_10]